MSHFRFRFIVRGGHTHISVFAGKRRETTHGRCGDLCMTNDEFADFRVMVHRAEIEFEDFEQEQIDNSQFGVGA